MQYYTKQQLHGSGKYAAPARMGNWNEDNMQDETGLKDYLWKKETGALQLDVMRFRMERSIGPTTLTTIANDGMLHLGDLVQINSCVNGAVISIDTEDTDPRPAEHACAVSAAHATHPRLRNTFLLVKYVPPKHPKYSADSKIYGPTYEDELVHYGQKVCIVAHAGAFGNELDDRGGVDPWYLRSVAQSNNHFSKLTRHQEVSVTPRLTYDCAWSVIVPDPSQRPKMEGQAVPINTQILLEHCSTRQHLNCEERMYWNDFGEEHEVSAHSTARYHRNQTNENVTNGCPMALVSRNQEASNLFYFTTGTTVARLPQATGLHTSKKYVLKKLLTQMSKMGANGFKSMEKIFKEFDTDGSGALSIKEFARALVFVNIKLQEDELQVMMSCFDDDNSGSINLDEFVTTLKAVDMSL